MDEHALRELIQLVKLGQLPRRRFVQTMVGLGLTAPLAAQMLAAAGIAQAQPRAAGGSPIRRGGGGPLRLLYWAAPTILNPHLAVSPKDLEASEMFYEPPADIDTDGNIVPVLARAAVAVGVAGLFIETHQDPDRAPSDGPNMVPLKSFEAMLRDLMAIDAVVKR